MTDRDAVSLCGRGMTGSQVAVVQNAQGHASYRGVMTCGSVWECPVCASIVGHKRAEEVDQAVRNHFEAGGGVAFLTLTVRHAWGEGLGDLLDVLSKAWDRLTSGGTWKRERDRYGVVGIVRVWEVTVGQNGWHPHVHALVFTEKPLTEADVEAWVGDRSKTDKMGRNRRIRGLFSRWADAAENLGAGRPTRTHGIDFRIVAGPDSAEFGDYLNKIAHDGERAETWSVGKEIARWDLKSTKQRQRQMGDGRLAKGVTPFELLDGIPMAALVTPKKKKDAKSDGTAYEPTPEEKMAIALWREWATATRGRRRIGWSRGLRERLGLTVEEKTDEELAAETEDDVEVVCVLDRDDWLLVHRYGADVDVLEVAEGWGEDGVRAYLARLWDDAVRRFPEYAEKAGVVV